MSATNDPGLIIPYLNSLQKPCPICGNTLIGARAYSSTEGAYWGLVCESCEGVGFRVIPQAVENV